MTLASVCAAIQRVASNGSSQRRDPLGEHVLAVHAEAEAGDRDADLRRGDVAVLPLRVLEDAQRRAGRAGCPVPAWCSMLGPRRADDRELRGDEQPVGEHEQQDDARGG